VSYAYGLVDVALTVDNSGLEKALTDLAERVDAVENQDGTIQDKVQEALDASNMESRLSTLEGLNTCGKDINNLITEDEARDIVDNKIYDLDYPDESKVQEMIDEALSGYEPDVDTLDEDDVRRIADEAISEADNTLVEELERRVDRYSQRVDALITGAQGMGKDIATLQAQVMSLTGNAQTVDTTLAQRIEALEERIRDQDAALVEDKRKIANLEARVDNHGVIADLLRDVARKILGLG